jgi:two-component system response regulator YesN
MLRDRVRTMAAITAVVASIHHGYWDVLSLPALARDVGRSPGWVSRQFRSVMGMTFRSYVVQVRLDRAKVLLRTRTTVSITEIAQTVGFGDLPRFNKLFKRAMGVTPSAYRRF